MPCGIYHRTELHKQRCRENGRLMIYHTKESKKKISVSQSGRKHSQKTLKLMSNIKKGKKNPFWGKHHTHFSNKQRSIISKNLWKSREFRNKIINGNKKHHKNPRYIQNMSKSTRKLWKNIDYRNKVLKAIQKALKLRP